MSKCCGGPWRGAGSCACAQASGASGPWRPAAQAAQPGDAASAGPTVRQPAGGGVCMPVGVLGTGGGAARQDDGTGAALTMAVTRASSACAQASAAWRRWASSPRPAVKRTSCSPKRAWASLTTCSRRANDVWASSMVVWRIARTSMRKAATRSRTASCAWPKAPETPACVELRSARSASTSRCMPLPHSLRAATNAASPMSSQRSGPKTAGPPACCVIPVVARAAAEPPANSMAAGLSRARGYNARPRNCRPTAPLPCEEQCDALFLLS